jgi:hypothetical protein
MTEAFFLAIKILLKYTLIIDYTICQINLVNMHRVTANPNDVVLEGFDIFDVRDVSLGGFRYYIRYIQKEMKGQKCTQGDLDLVELELRRFYYRNLKGKSQAQTVDQVFSAALEAIPTCLEQAAFLRIAQKPYQIYWDESALAMRLKGIGLRVICSDDAHLYHGKIEHCIQKYDSLPDETSLRYENAAILRAMNPQFRLEAVWLAFSDTPELARMICSTHPDLDRWYQEAAYIPKYTKEALASAKHLLGCYEEKLQNMTYLRLDEKLELLRFLIAYVRFETTPRQYIDRDLSQALNTIIYALNVKRSGHLLPLCQ